MFPSPPASVITSTSTVTPHILDRCDLNTILIELYTLSKTQLIYVNHKNGRKTQLQFLGCTVSKRGYEQFGEGKVNTLVNQLAKNEIHNNSDEPVVAGSVVKTLRQKYPVSFFHSVASIKVPRLDKFQTAALIEYMNITDTVAYDKHMYTHIYIYIHRICI